jgi:hypothetical protein
MGKDGPERIALAEEIPVFLEQTKVQSSL